MPLFLRRGRGRPGETGRSARCRSCAPLNETSRAMIADAVTGRGLAGDREVALRADGRGQDDVAADVEHHDAAAVADRVAERPGARRSGSSRDRPPSRGRRSPPCRNPRRQGTPAPARWAARPDRRCPGCPRACGAARPTGGGPATRAAGRSATRVRPSRGAGCAAGTGRRTPPGASCATSGTADSPRASACARRGCVRRPC